MIDCIFNYFDSFSFFRSNKETTFLSFFSINYFNAIISVNDVVNDTIVFSANLHSIATAFVRHICHLILSDQVLANTSPTFISNFPQQ
jgi:hypothetical protein